MQDMSYRPTEHKAQKVRVTGYLLWDDEHNGSADVRSAIQYIAATDFIILGVRPLGKFTR